MIKPFAEYIGEDILTDIIVRDRTGNVRREDGRKVHTCLDIDIILKNPNFDYIGMNYNDILKQFIDECNNDESPLITIETLRYCGLSPDEIKNIRSGELKYSYTIKNGEVLIDFPSYEDRRCYETDEFANEISEDDYVSLCKCVSEKFKQIENYIEYVPRRNSYTNKSIRNSYNGSYQLCLIDDNSVYNYMNENNVDTIDDFFDDLYDEFDELDGEDILLWTYQYGSYIGLPINYNNIMNIEKYSKFAHDWFKQ